MTKTPPPDPQGESLLAVEQVDREAAASWAKSNSRHAQAANMRRGSCDTAPLVQAFTRHRLASSPPAQQAGEDALREALAKALCDHFDEDWSPDGNRQDWLDAADVGLAALARPAADDAK